MIPLSSLLPIPQRCRPNNPRKPRARHPNPVLTSSDSMEFIREKDKEFAAVLKAKSAGKKPLRKYKGSDHVRQAVNEKPQPWYEGGEGMVCVFCYTEYGSKDILQDEDKWVQCPWCYCWLHYDCIRVAKECTCGEKIRLRRKCTDPYA